MKNVFNLKDKKILITGGTGGIGSSMIRNFLIHEGSEVFFTSSSDEKAEKLISSIGTREKLSYGICDMTKPEDISAVIKAVYEKMGDLDILICNAGMTSDKLFMRMGLDDWNKVIGVNLSANFQLASEVFKKMALKKKKGRILFISSIIASLGNIGQANYAASKAGLEGMMRSIALEGGRFGITANAVAPGFISTDMTDKIPEDIKNKMKEKIPCGLFGQTEDICNVVGFLASDASHYITGQVVHVNGGMYLG
jgi:3-oxoacyl-[acyl-carrier protein] reductase